MANANISIIPQKRSAKENSQAAAKPISRMEQLYRSRFIATLSNISDAYISFTDPMGAHTFGDETAQLQCVITINSFKAYSEIALGGSNGAAQAYIDGLWQTDDLTALIRILVRNRSVLEELEGGAAQIAQWFLRVWHSRNNNSRSGSARNISAHYDLSNEFFDLFLDQHKMYSSALFTDQTESLDDASSEKLHRICQQLELCETDHVLEIGSGWGGFACYAAKNFACKVTTITISKEQQKEAIERVKQQGLEHLVDVQLLDYRDINGQFDKVVSIEMVEAVGHQYLDGYFNTIQQALVPGGRALIQAIVIEDHRYQQSLKEVDYIKRFVFPGSFIPCYSVLSQSAAKNHLVLDGLHDMGLSYATTLKIWRERFEEKLEQVKQLGFDEQFIRMWRYYLCYCEGGFAERAISVGQISFRKATD
jgi:cyclopropane-fatty-acyl-phospholipid synthase